MSTDRTRSVTEFDRLADAWLADGPTELSDRVLDDALREVHLTHQRRRGAAPWSGPFGPRRFPQMNILAKAVIGLVAVLVLAVGGYSFIGAHQGVGAPSPSPEPTIPRIGSPVPGPYLDGTFTSPLYGYVAHYPSTWRITPATRMWTTTINSGHDTPYWGDAALDTLQGTDVRLVVWGQPIPQAQGLTQSQAVDLWVRNLKIGSAPCVADSQLPQSFATAQLQGQGFTVINGCGPVSDGVVKDGVIYEVAVVRNGVGWEFTFDGHVNAGFVDDFLAAVGLPAAGLGAAPSPVPAASPGG